MGIEDSEKFRAEPRRWPAFCVNDPSAESVDCCNTGVWGLLRLPITSNTNAWKHAAEWVSLTPHEVGRALSSVLRHDFRNYCTRTLTLPPQLPRPRSLSRRPPPAATTAISCLLFTLLANSLVNDVFKSFARRCLEKQDQIR